MRPSHWLIIYDIRNVKRLVKVEKCVESYARRIQKSVFESDAPAATIRLLQDRLALIIDEKEDFVLIFSVCEKDWQKKESFGTDADKTAQDDRFSIL